MSRTTGRWRIRTGEMQLIMLFRTLTRHFMYHPLRIFKCIDFKNWMYIIYLVFNSAWCLVFRTLWLCWIYFNSSPQYSKLLRNNDSKLLFKFSICFQNFHVWWIVTNSTTNSSGYIHTFPWIFSIWYLWVEKCQGVPLGFTYAGRLYFASQY